jgi:hypothetical protein
VVSKNETFCKSCVALKLEGEKKSERSPGLAAFLSVIIGGAGQMYNGQPGKGIFIFLTTWLVIPWIYGIFDAYQTAKKMNEGKIAPAGRHGCGTAAIIIVVIFIVLIPIAGLLTAIALPNFIKARQGALSARGAGGAVRLVAPRPAAKAAPEKAVQNILGGIGKDMYKVHLSNGHRFEATIDKETDSIYIFQIGNGTFQVNKRDILEMDKIK